MTWWMWFGAGAVIGFLLLLWSLMRIAAEADRRAERLYRDFQQAMKRLNGDQD